MLPATTIGEAGAYPDLVAGTIFIFWLASFPQHSAADYSCDSDEYADYAEELNRRGA